MVQILNRPLLLLLRTGDTRLLRIFFSLGSIGFVLWSLFDKDFAAEHQYMLALANHNRYLFATAFAVHAISTFYGVLTKRYSIPLAFTEALLGWFLWLGGGIAEAVEQGAPGPMLLSGGLLATFLLIRYPTHNEESR